MDNSTDQKPGEPGKHQRTGRWIGGFMFLGGCGLAYLSIILPLLAASRHEDDISISLKAVVLATALVVIGLILFIMGDAKAGQLFGTRQKPSVKGIVICLVIIGIGLLLYEWLKSKLRAYGYEI